MVTISKRDEEFRKESLYSKNIIKLIFKICLPLALFQFISNLFNLLDALMASYISQTAVSTIAYMVQLQHIAAAIGTGFSVGGSILIAHSYGKGDYEKVKKDLSSLIMLCLVISVFILMLIPFTPSILNLLGTPEGFIKEGSTYFSIILLSIVINYFNTIYIAIEKARGNSKIILKLNILVIIVKLSLSALFIYLLNAGINMVAIATLLSYLSLFIIAIINLTKNNDAFSFSIKYASLRWNVISPIIKLSLPTMIEKIAFSFGKAVINQMSAAYSEITVGAAGISNNMSGMLTGFQIGFQDGGTSLISQNMGVNNLSRVLKIYTKIVLLQLSFSIIGNILYLFLTGPISFIFASSKEGFSREFQVLIILIFKYEIFGCIILSFAYAASSLLLGLKETRLVMVINIFRVFVFRIPVMYLFTHYTTIGPKAVGYTMFISNTLTGIFAFIISIYAIKRTAKALSRS